MKEITGRYQATGKGYGFLIPDDGSADYFLPPRAQGSAWHNDLVTGRPGGQTPEDGRRTAVVTGILQRNNRSVTGIIGKRGREVWLTPDSDRLPLPGLDVLGRV
ncbi:MAG TPA: hypothetical protein PK597_04935, partial [Oscillospiraceae bacterium]|nr:hypothetical protein [Oscillospiraceae bacterium]